jgi:hypothetical protein
MILLIYGDNEMSKITQDELDEIEIALYSEENQENYNLAEWARLIIPRLIKEIREDKEEISNLYKDKAGIDI